MHKIETRHQNVLISYKDWELVNNGFWRGLWHNCATVGLPVNYSPMWSHICICCGKEVPEHLKITAKLITNGENNV